MAAYFRRHNDTVPHPPYQPAMLRRVRFQKPRPPTFPSQTPMRPLIRLLRRNLLFQHPRYPACLYCGRFSIPPNNTPTFFSGRLHPTVRKYLINHSVSIGFQARNLVYTSSGFLSLFGLIRLMSTWRNVLQDRVYKVFVCALSFNKAHDNLLSVKDSPEANSSCP